MCTEFLESVEVQITKWKGCLVLSSGYLQAFEIEEKDPPRGYIGRGQDAVEPKL